MKRIFTLILLGYVTLLFGQQNKVTFDKKLTYQFNRAGENHFQEFSDTKIVTYTNGKATLVSINTQNNGDNQFFVDENGVANVSMGFDNVLTGFLDPSQMYPIFGYDESEEEVTTQKIAAVNLNSSKTIAGITCNEYLLKPVFGNSPDEGGQENMKACINESHTVNSIPVLSAFFNRARMSKVEFLNLSGLIVKIGNETDYDTNYLVLKSLDNTDTSVYFDSKANLVQQKQAVDSLKAEYKKMHSSIDSTAAVADSAFAFDEDYVVSQNYESTYKKRKTEEAGLAIDNMPSEKHWNILPSHCRKIDDELPNFENKELGLHVKNYVGQVCDLYLTQEEYDNVDEKGTIDEVRREVLYFNEIREKLSQSDKNKLDKYLKNLD